SFGLEVCTTVLSIVHSLQAEFGGKLVNSEFGLKVRTIVLSIAGCLQTEFGGKLVNSVLHFNPQPNYSTSSIYLYKHQTPRKHAKKQFPSIHGIFVSTDPHIPKRTQKKIPKPLLSEQNRSLHPQKKRGELVGSEERFANRRSASKSTKKPHPPGIGGSEPRELKDVRPKVEGSIVSS
ncbi:hypothetical protein WN55_01205, partial [Dufourea novaeangliae]